VSGGAGTLSVVGTPIGNLGDLTFRAAAVLLQADAVICEDTRRTGKLLAHIRQLAVDGDVSTVTGEIAHGGPRPDGASRIRADLLVANEHTEFSRIPEVLDRLAQGQSVALVTDAGMPTISDPGAAVVRAVSDAGYRVDVVPGPSAVSAALAVAGMAADRYVFEGFLPRRGAERQTRLTTLGTETRTIVVYEAPHRIIKTLRDLAAVCGGERPVVVARELTKLHEEADRTTLAQASKRFSDESPRGEFVLVLAGAPPTVASPSDLDLVALIDDELSTGVSTRDAVASVVAQTGQPKRKIYDLANSRGRPVAEQDQGGDAGR